MSFASTADEHGVFAECRGPGCDVRKRRWELRHGEFCTEACEIRRRGRDALDAIIHDHRYCGHCARKLKDVTGVPPAWYWSGFQTETAAAFKGYQFRRPEAETGERERPRLAAADATPPVIGTGTVCGVCGATDLADPVPWADHTRPIEAAGLFCDALRREGVADPDVATVMHTLVDTRDFELAIGRGIEA